MGISRDSRHKRRETGGKRAAYRKKRKFELGRPPAMTRIGVRRVHTVRCRGGNLKFRALRLDNGNFSWGSEVCTRKTRILDVVYNASNNELVRTKTLVKGAIIQIDATPFKQWYAQHYGVELGKTVKNIEDNTDAKVSATDLAKFKANREHRVLDTHLETQFATGRLLAAISSRPGQCGRCDGYILEGKELEFYQRQLAKKKKGQKA